MLFPTGMGKPYQGNLITIEAKGEFVKFLVDLVRQGLRYAVFTAAVLPVSAAPGTPIQSADEAAIRSILQGQQDAWNKGDAKAFSAHAAEDCLFTNIVGTPVVGREGFEDRHAFIFRTIYAGSHLEFNIRTFKMVTADVAIVESELKVTNFKGLPPGIHAMPDGAIYTELEEVFVKRQGAWEMIAFHNVDRKLPPPVAAKP